MDALRVLSLVKEGLGSNLWGLGCPIHCRPTSLTSLALSFLLGLISGVFGFRLGFLHLGSPPSSPSRQACLTSFAWLRACSRVSLLLVGLAWLLGWEILRLRL